MISITPKVIDDSKLKILLLQMMNKSVIVIEGLDLFSVEKSKIVSLSGLLNFINDLQYTNNLPDLTEGEKEKKGQSRV